MKIKTLIIPFLLISQLIFAQQSEIQIHGSVKDSRTSQSIIADIRYSSIPTGSIHGIFKDSVFAFPIFGTAKYQVTVNAEGYLPKTIIVDPRSKDFDSRLFNDILLTPSGQTIRLNHLIFKQSKSVIEEESFSELDEVAQMMKENEKMIIQLEGHTDNQGGVKANQELSQSRVEAVKKYLVKKGIAKDRIKTKAFGGSQPLMNEQTSEAKALNRRVEIRVLKY